MLEILEHFPEGWILGILLFGGAYLMSRKHSIEGIVNKIMRNEKL